MEEVKEVLDKMNINYDIIFHPAVTTVEEAKKYIEGINVIPTKTMFMENKNNKKFYLFVLPVDKKLNLKDLDTIQFGKEKDLKEKMNLTFGTVSIFGLLNNKERDIKVYIDSVFKKTDKVTFHPNDNTKTILILVHDIIKFLDNLNYEYEFIKLV